MRKYQQLRQQEFSGFSDTQVTYRKFISVFRISLVKDRHIQFEQKHISDSQQAHLILKRLIEVEGNPDREQFCIALLNAKNQIIGLNIVSIGGLSSAPVDIANILKPAILANAAAMILCHNHPSCDITPSSQDINITKKIVKAAKIMGISVLEHLVISMYMYDNSYYSFADNGLITQAYNEAG